MKDDKEFPKASIKQECNDSWLSTMILLNISDKNGKLFIIKTNRPSNKKKLKNSEKDSDFTNGQKNIEIGTFKRETISKNEGTSTLPEQWIPVSSIFSWEQVEKFCHIFNINN